MKFNWTLPAAASIGVFLALSLPAQDTKSAAAPQTIVIHAKKFAFDPAEITLKKGEPVTLELTSDDVEHSLVIHGLHINAIMKKGVMTKVSITPDTIGDFPGSCGKFCGSGHGRMRFVAHVVDK